MAENDSLIKSVRRTDAATVVALSGDVDLHHVPALHAALMEITATRPRKLIIDLSDVPYMDSSGVGTLIVVRREIDAHKGKLALVGLTPRVRGVFEITKLDKFFTICASEDEALRA